MEIYHEICPKCNKAFESNDDSLVAYCPKCGTKIAAYKNGKHIILKTTSHDEIIPKNKESPINN
jgi:predicted  nucleic acid-binding Zn-ribbon protein